MEPQCHWLIRHFVRSVRSSKSFHIIFSLNLAACHGRQVPLEIKRLNDIYFPQSTQSVSSIPPSMEARHIILVMYGKARYLFLRRMGTDVYLGGSDFIPSSMDHLPTFNDLLSHGGEWEEVHPSRLGFR